MREYRTVVQYTERNLKIRYPRTVTKKFKVRRIRGKIRKLSVNFLFPILTLTVLNVGTY